MLFLKQRLEKKEGKSSADTKAKERDVESTKLSQETGEAAPTAQSGRVTVAFLGPTIIALAIAMVWYHYNA
ncbi:hypothetical protein P3T76_000755 [Phytophthora citrophthora]|uniref:Uncharacterized protein n=1 Tax=Phytophthora citrophthora TaxID=4793 RepID=A0AAD9H2P7_9STRA|nr:hypothetical protein P3T76_000755 [Phytophthora citrophthora]